MSITFNNGEYLVNGDLNFEQAAKIFNSLDVAGIDADEINVNLSDVGSSDSAALAVMLEWLHQAKSLNKKISFSHVPDQLMHLISMSDLQNLFGLTD